MTRWVEAAFWVAVAQTGSSPGFVRDIVFEVAVGGGALAAGAGACGVPDLGEVPELDTGIMPLGLVPVIAAFGGDRLDVQEQVALAGDPGGEPPAAFTPAGRAGLAGGGEGEPGPAGRIGTVRFIWFGVLPGALADAGRAEPRPMAWPWLSVTVTHQVERGLRAAAARSRARSESPEAVHGMRSGRSASGQGRARLQRRYL